MSEIKAIFRNHLSEIVDDINEELLNDRIVRFWRRVGSDMTLREVLNKYWEDKSEFAVDLGVTFGKIFELYLPFKLKELGYNVVPGFSSAGDMIEGDTHWEIKTGRGKFIQGATHSPKEKSALNLIQVLWDCHWDKTLDEIDANGKFISHLNVCVFNNVVVDSVGEHSNNNSRTTLQFKRDKYDECVDACVYGSIKKNRINIAFVKESVDGN